MTTGPLRIGNLFLLPSIHGRLTFAEEVRRRFFVEQPHVVAVELPASLRAPILQGIERLPALTAVCFRENESPEARLCYVPIDPCDAMIEAVRLAREHGVMLAFVDLDVADYQEPHVELPCDFVADQAGYEAYCATVWPFLAARDDAREDASAAAIDDARNRHIATRLRALTAEYGKTLWVGGFGHWPGVVRHYLGGHSGRSAESVNEREDKDEDESASGRRNQASSSSRDDAVLAAVSPRSYWQFLVEIPYVAHLYECARAAERLDHPGGLPKLEAIRTIFLESEQAYRRNYKETINLTQWRALMQFTRNLTLWEGRYRPALYDVVVAAKSCVDGDYGYETYRVATSYPSAESPDDLPRLSLHRGHARLEDCRYRAKPRWPEPESELVHLRFRRRPRPRERALWKALWELMPRLGICSWPPEDELQERFMDSVRKRALQTLTEDRARTHEFSASILDGLDIRETMRNWHTGKLYVREQPPPLGKVGPVVLIFEDQPIDAEPAWRETLYAENNNESDIAFFAEPLGEHVVGPGICYTHFNGILSVFPACHIPNPWEDPVVGEYPTCAEKLLAAAILYARHRFIAYVAATPPLPHLRELAAANRRHILYLPLPLFSKKTLKSIRRFHILDGKHVRRYAAEYIE